MILKSTACLFIAKKKAAILQPFLNSLGWEKLHSHYIRIKCWYYLRFQWMTLKQHYRLEIKKNPKSIATVGVFEFVLGSWVLTFPFHPYRPFHPYHHPLEA
jgi:hypothetical protein